ncbi:hypothetical protein BDY17DRAFT_324390 [Neohortaea acidophila]|uniref:Uncharacterized protein n=1 Tax=Neohortaea acidophila TaxID=245834 RepID=A0A6A6PVB6_9PEZI|nr:uncharacterized protein BDY17DRAFT_324390 [Neohortaea acidophila]KAF2483674.1 hypothetical protein BDY17DRAFT_324390 [Neohortaea acidophila]
MYLQVLPLLFLPTAFAQASQQPIIPTHIGVQCTSTITETIPWGCTVTEPAITTTQPVDCAGCVLSTTSRRNGLFGVGPVCIGGRTTVLDAGLKKTITVCASGSGGQCTSTITDTIPYGCTVTGPANTATTAVDCGGCVLSTTSSINALFGVGPVCIGGRTTVPDPESTSTVTVCAPSGYARDEVSVPIKA